MKVSIILAAFAYLELVGVTRTPFATHVHLEARVVTPSRVRCTLLSARGELVNDAISQRLEPTDGGVVDLRLRIVDTVQRGELVRCEVEAP